MRITLTLLIVIQTITLLWATRVTDSWHAWIMFLCTLVGIFIGILGTVVWLDGQNFIEEIGKHNEQSSVP